jgi:hypothetical protein
VVCAAIAVVLAVSATVYVYERIRPCVDRYEVNSSSYNHCVRDRLLP